MVKITWTETAVYDLNDIAEYIAVDNVSAAEKLVKNIFKKVERLEEFPESGRIVPELSYLSYREVVIPPCRIFYKIKDNIVYILYVMRVEQDLKKFVLSHLNS